MKCIRDSPSVEVNEPANISVITHRPAGAVLEKNMGARQKVDDLLSRRPQKAGNRGQNYQINHSNPPKTQLFRGFSTAVAEDMGERPLRHRKTAPVTLTDTS